MDLGLKGRVAVVMAASEGIGYGAAAALAADGARVGICARRAATLDAAAKKLRAETGAEVFTKVLDVSKPGESAAMIDATVAHFGQRRLDVLVNNGGGPKPAASIDLSDEDWRAAFELLVLSNVRACRAAFPHMRTQGGSIINVASTSVKQPIDNLVLSNSLRSAVVAFAKTLSLEWGKHAIRVNNVLPGFTLTGRADEILRDQARRLGRRPDEVRREREAQVPLGRFASVTDIGALIAFLASSAASNITGQTWTVDGGATRWVHG